MLYNQAKAIAENVAEILQPHCTVLHIAGSIRRQKETVKDIEIVALPNTTFTDLFKTETKRTEDYLQAVQSLGEIIKGNPSIGKYVQIWLPERKVMVDLFTPADYDYYRIFAIRTGSADYAHHVIANAWLKKGWCGIPNGLRLQSECEQQKDKSWKCTTQTPTFPPVWQNEQDFFTWLNVEYTEPRYREINHSFNKELYR